MPESPLPPGFATPVFVQQGRWVTAATTVTNPNTRWWLPEIRLGFVVYDRHGRKLARRSTTISVPPGGSVRATAPAISTRPRAASTASVVLDPEPARWVDLEDFAPPGLRLDGAAVSKSREGKVAVVAMLSNRTAALGAGKLVCVTTDAAGGLTGAIAVVISFPAHQQGPVSIPVPRPAGGSLAADCEIGPAGR